MTIEFSVNREKMDEVERVIEEAFPKAFCYQVLIVEPGETNPMEIAAKAMASGASSFKLLP